MTLGDIYAYIPTKNDRFLDYWLSVLPTEVDRTYTSQGSMWVD